MAAPRKKTSRKSGADGRKSAAGAHEPRKAGDSREGAETAAGRARKKRVPGREPPSRDGAPRKGPARTPRRKRAEKDEARGEQTRNSVWTGTLGFGLVAIPVRLVPVVKPRRPPFRMVHRPDLAPLRRGLRCPREQDFVDPEEISLGYEIEPDRFVVVTREELESVAPERSRSIELTAFVGLDEVPPVYFENAYYVVPAGSPKAYALLTEALKQQKKAGVGRFVLHTREHPVAVQSVEGALCLFTLRFPDEIRPAEEVPVLSEPANPLSESLRRRIRPQRESADLSRYEDPYWKRLEALLRRIERTEGSVEINEGEPEQEAAEAPEVLMEALEKSLAGAKRRKGRTRGRPAA